MKTSVLEFGEVVADVVKKKKRGAPVKDPAAVKIRNIPVYVTAEELRLLKAMHKTATTGRTKSLSQFMIDTVLAEKGTGERSKRVDSSIMRIIRIDLSGAKRAITLLGSNYNQSVKRINNLLVSKELKAEVQQGNAMLNEARELIKKMDTLINRITENFVESSKKVK